MCDEVAAHVGVRFDGQGQLQQPRRGPAALMQADKHRGMPERPGPGQQRLVNTAADAPPGGIQHQGQFVVGAIEQGAPQQLTHDRCGKDFTPQTVCSACGEEIDSREVSYRSRR